VTTCRLLWEEDIFLKMFPFIIQFETMSQYSAVGIATGCGLDGRGVEVRVLLKRPIHDQSCCATVRVVQHDWSCMVLIDLIVNGQTCVAQNNFAQHDWSCMGPLRSRIFYSTTSSRPPLGPTQSPFWWVPGGLSSGVKLLGREADHSPRTSAEVKKTWIYTSTLPYAFMA
jgi:hypothetical protein